MIRHNNEGNITETNNNIIDLGMKHFIHKMKNSATIPYYNPHKHTSNTPTGLPKPYQPK
jgi:hypothetical protein